MCVCLCVINMLHYLRVNNTIAPWYVFITVLVKVNICLMLQIATKLGIPS